MKKGEKTATLLVFIGGGLGSLCRFLIVFFSPYQHAVSTFIVNCVACFLVGVVDTVLTNSKITRKSEQNLRGFLTTGFLGGFSTLAALSGKDESILWIIGTVAFGAIYAKGGIRLANHLLKIRDEK